MQGAYNAVWVKGKLRRGHLLLRVGRGPHPTGVAVVSDLMRVAREIRSGSPGARLAVRARAAGRKQARLGHAAEAAPITCVSAWTTGPASSPRWPAFWPSKHIGLEAVLQEPCDTKHDLPFVITVEQTSEQSIREAVEKMSRLDFMREAPLALPDGAALMKMTACAAFCCWPGCCLAPGGGRTPTPATRPRSGAKPSRSGLGRSGPRRTAEARQELVEEMGVKPGMTVADVGTGVGYMLPFLSRAVGPTAR